MRTPLLVSLCALLAACQPHPSAAVAPPASALAVLAAPSAAPPTVSAKAPEEKARTPEALALLLADYDRRLAAGEDAASLAHARDAIGLMAGQRDAHVSRLFWYTDLEQAKSAAQRLDRPILALRLLGRLDEELSCANSRLFRLVLYSNPKVAALLRDQYVLFWSSERPVPQMTVDFGDGRVLRRTLTGNSVHYVLDAQGRLVDALPGLYGPAAFERRLRESLELAQKSGALGDEDSAKAVAKYHTRAVWALTAAWRKELGRVYGESYAEYVAAAHLPTPATASWPHPLYASLPARVVNELTINKADMEAPTLALLQPEIHAYEDAGDWTKIAAGLPAERLAPESLALLREKHPRDFGSREAGTLDEKALDKRVAELERRLTEEELKNEYTFHGAVHGHLTRVSRVDLASTNDFVYTRLFMTPKSDAWLGLTSSSTITGIEDDGVAALK